MVNPRACLRADQNDRPLEGPRHDSGIQVPFIPLVVFPVGTTGDFVAAFARAR